MNFLFKKNKILLVGLVLLFFLLGITFILPMIIPQKASMWNYTYKSFLEPGLSHWIGTDSLGHDVFSYLIRGTVTSLYIAVISVSISFIIGVILGILGGYFSGFWDIITNFICDYLIVFPDFILAFLIMFFLKTGIYQLIMVLSICYLPTFIKNIKNATIKITSQDFVKNALALGANHSYIIRKHIFPHLLPTLLIRIALSLSSVILVASSFGFIGIGLDNSIPEWGLLLSLNKAYIYIYPRLFFFPMMFIIFTNLAFNFIAEGINEFIE
ncbi:MAG: ABC transporter permease [Candidatus Phytoplasma australasiaticum]|nr:ABC transporter permease [Candidatus Phytoplasma australasiaticum]